MSSTTTRQSDQARTPVQEGVAAQGSKQVLRALHDDALEAVTGGGRSACTNNLKQIALGAHL